MRYVSPTVYVLGQSRKNDSEIRRWLDDLGATGYTPPETATDSEVLVSLAAKRCYMSFEPLLNPNVTRVRTDMAEFIDNILKSRHGSVLAHVVFTFGIEGVSRVFTAEFNRHSAGTAISEGSLRFIRFVDIPWWIPTSLLGADDDDHDTRLRKDRTFSVFNRAFCQDEENYRELEEIWDLTGVNAQSKAFSVKKKLTSMFRRIIGMGVATGGVWSGNLRALRHIFGARCDPAAEEEILLVASLMLQRMREAEPILFGDFTYTDGYWRPTYWKV